MKKEIVANTYFLLLHLYFHRRSRFTNIKQSYKSYISYVGDALKRFIVIHICTILSPFYLLLNYRWLCIFWLNLTSRKCFWSSKYLQVSICIVLKKWLIHLNEYLKHEKHFLKMRSTIYYLKTFEIECNSKFMRLQLAEFILHFFLYITLAVQICWRIYEHISWNVQLTFFHFWLC